MFVRKFKPLLEMTDSDVTPPASACLRYAVCAYDVDACGWHGWTLEAVWRAPDDEAEASRDPYERLLPTATEAICPRCKRPLCDADVSDVYLTPTPNPHPEVDIEVTPREYADDPWRQLAKQYLSLELARTAWGDRGADADEWHEHCETCNATISDDPADLDEAMSDGAHRWVCLACWARMERAAARGAASTD